MYRNPLNTAFPFFCSLILCATAQLAPAAPAVKLANHPTAGFMTSPSIHSIRRIEDRVYFGYGDWNTFPAVALVSYDPAGNRFILEHAPGSDSMEMIREWNGTIYIAHCDPAHYEDYHDYSYRGPDGRWLESSVLEGLHWFDFAQTGDGLFAAGDGLYRSLNEGRTWTLINPSSRCYFIGARDGAVHTSFGRYKAGVYTSSTIVSPAVWNQSMAFQPADGGPELLIGVGNRTPGISVGTDSYNVNGWAFNGTMSRSLPLSCKSLTIENNALHLLAGTSVRITSTPLTVLPSAYGTAPVSGIPLNATSMELMGGRYYFGTLNGEIWTANADGSPTTLAAPTVVNRIPDQFGRGLALDGDTLAVGAPNAAAASTWLAGKAEMWAYGISGWEKKQEIPPPVPDFSGWFGKDLAVSGDLLAVVEAGFDAANTNRGANAKVQLYQSIGGIWTRQRTLELPFVHSVAFAGGMLFAATANPAPDQQTVRPGIKPYPILRAGDGSLAVTTTIPQLLPGSSSYGYKPVTRVAVMGDLVMGGFSGDPSRAATGVVSVFRRAADGNSYARVQEIVSTAAQRFGFSIAAHNGWMAIGSPFASMGDPHTGSVQLYQLSPEPGAAVPFTLVQTLLPPVAGVLPAQGEFGASLAMHGSLLLVGRPGLEVAGNRQKGAVYKYKLTENETSPWRSCGMLPPPSASMTEFGIEVACNEKWLAAGSLACIQEAEGLDSRIRLIPRSGYEEWMDGFLVSTRREPGADADDDATANLLEYAFHLHPLQNNSGPAAHEGPEPSGFPVLTPPGPSEGASLTFVRPARDERISMAVQFSGNLTIWGDVQGVPAVISAGEGWELVRIPLPDSTAGNPGYVRVKVGYASE